MRELFQALSLLESRLLESHGISLNEAVVLCSVGTETVTASTIVSRTGMTPSHASKVIRMAEEKGMLERTPGTKDKRQMYFVLTGKAKTCLAGIREQGVEIPEMLAPLFREHLVGGRRQRIWLNINSSWKCPAEQTGYCFIPVAHPVRRPSSNV